VGGGKQEGVDQKGGEGVGAREVVKGEEGAGKRGEDDGERGHKTWQVKGLSRCRFLFFFLSGGYAWAWN
jgi:hypothetical protein